MSSVVLASNVDYGNQPSYNSAIVERIPSIPDISFWVRLQQEKATRPYTVSWGQDSSTFRIIYSNSNELSDMDALAIIESAHILINKNVKDIDPAFQEFIEDNFDDLLWS